MKATGKRLERTQDYDIAAAIKRQEAVELKFWAKRANKKIKPKVKPLFEQEGLPF